MSKQATRAGKPKPAKDTKKPNATEKQLSTLLEIVPGKFNENDWNNMLETDDSQEFIWELIDEVFDNTIKIIYTNYLDKKTIPYTISQAKNAILHIIEWQFVSKEDQPDLIEDWVEDEEPESCIIDSWAQGYVQAVITETKDQENSQEAKNDNLVLIEELNKIVEEPLQERPPINEFISTLIKSNDLMKNDEESKQVKKLNITKEKARKPPVRNAKIENLSEPIEKVEQENLDNSLTLRSLNKYNKIISPEKKRLDESISKAPVACQSVLKTLLNRPPALREVEIDPYGNIEFIAKLDYDKVATGNVKTKFSIVKDVEKTTSTYDFKKSKPNTENTNIPIEKISSDRNLNADKSANISKHNRIQAQFKKSRVPLNDECDISLDPAPGVVFSILNSTRVGPKRTNIANKHQIILDKTESFLKPVKQLDKYDVSISVDQILGNIKENNVKIQPKLKTIPPINSIKSVN